MRMSTMTVALIVLFCTVLFGGLMTSRSYLERFEDASGNPVVDPNDPSKYLLKKIDNTSGIVQPTLGIIIEFAAKRKK